MTQLGEVNAHLVLASGLEAALDQRGAVQLRDRLDIRHRTPRIAGRRTLRTPEMAVGAA